MQWRRRHCCTHIAGLLFVLSFVGLLLILGHYDWTRGRVGRRDTSVASGTRGFQQGKAEGNLSFSLRNVWKESAAQAAQQKPKVNFSLYQDEQGVTGLETSLGANSSLSEEMRAAGALLAQPYPYVINEPDKCRDSSPFLVLLIAAEPEQADARHAIRQTWGNESVADGMGFVRLFLLGVRKGNNGAQLQRRINVESQKYHDIIQQEYLDTYYNLTIKTLMGMYWVATHCPRVMYVMKTDSDMFVNTEYLIQKLLKPNEQPKQGYFTGYLMRGYAPNRNKKSKWYMPPELYPSERYPTFCSGTGYVFSGDMAAKIYRASLSIRRLHLEDVYVGICLAKLRIEPAPPPNEFLFNHWHVSYSSCKYSHLITSHQFHPNELLKYWHHLQSNKHNACINVPKDKTGRFRQRKLHWAPLVKWEVNAQK
ncbi:beta-1,3-galactosyltransferase 2-like [Denticeps clupeoides]|uniref:Hexosyltransferase n=1 Tax=Denticeps clupeoides TaxID=299321 RepID=A0AAY4ABE1_9TELE|nr:beta-1,3-galactosyltransferase 2-like [Denticeps clupeoides]